MYVCVQRVCVHLVRFVCVHSVKCVGLCDDMPRFEIQSPFSQTWHIELLLLGSICCSRQTQLYGSVVQRDGALCVP